MADQKGYDPDAINRFFTSAAVDRLRESWYCPDQDAVISQDDLDLDEIESSADEVLFDLTVFNSDQARLSGVATSAAPSAPNIAVGHLLGESDSVTTLQLILMQLLLQR